MANNGEIPKFEPKITKIRVDSDVDNYDDDPRGYTFVADGAYCSGISVKSVSDKKFRLMANFSDCDHKNCGAFGDTDCEESLTRLRMTFDYGSQKTVEMFRDALKHFKKEADERELGDVPVGGLLEYWEVTNKLDQEWGKDPLVKLGFTGDFPDRKLDPEKEN